MQIRKAKLKDLDDLVNLVCKLQQIHVDWDDFRYTSVKRCRQLSREDLKNGIYSNKKCIFVVEENNKILGYISGTLITLPGRQVSPYIRGRLNNIYLDSKIRGKKLGRQLIINLVKWFKQKKAKELSLSVDCKNIKAISFYKKLGFQDFAIEMVKEI